MKHCSKCQAQNRDEARFCTACANPFPGPSYCPACGCGNSPKAKFCKVCGSAIQAATASPALAPKVATGQLPPNSMVGERYLIVRKLGQGGMGAVYQVSDTRLGNRMCAMKEMSTSALLDPLEKQSAQAAFRQEAHLLSTLSHPNLPRVTDYLSEGDKQFLVMDYVEGQTVADRLAASSKPFPEALVLQWASQLCDVLHYLHTRPHPIVFRDLKPGNIMLLPDQQTIKLIDFGIARLFKPGAAKDTMALGTPGYAPPEQYGKGQSDARSDIYALAATLHHLLTLRDPGDEPFKFPRLRLLNPAVSLETEAAIRQALEQNPAQRWQTMQEFQAALLHLLPAASPLPVHAPQPAILPAAAAATPAPQAGTLVYTPAGQVFPAPFTAVPAYADNSPRFLAFLVDSLIVGLGSGLLALPISLTGDESAAVLCLLLIILWSFGYYTYFHAISGQTPGKKLAKIKVVRRDGAPLSFGRALWRSIIFLVVPGLLTVFCYIGWVLQLWPLWDKEHRAMHDYLADTWVIKQ